MAVISTSHEYQVQLDDGEHDKPRWITWYEDVADDEIDARLAKARLAHPNDRFRKVRITYDVFDS